MEVFFKKRVIGETCSLFDQTPKTNYNRLISVTALSNGHVATAHGFRNPEPAAIPRNWEPYASALNFQYAGRT